MRRQHRARALVPAPNGARVRIGLHAHGDAARVILTRAARQRTVEQLRQRLGWSAPAPSDARPALALLSGLPGTGKSHLAEALARRFPMVVLRSDEVRKALYATPRYTSDENGHVYLTCYALIDALLRDRYAVVFDATNLMKRGRREARRLAAAAGAPFVLLVTTSPPDIVAERLRQRAAGEAANYSSDADWLVHEKLAGTMEAIAADREPAVVVDTSVSLEPAFNALAPLIGAPPPERAPEDA